jgi:hypothetical protein
MRRKVQLPFFEFRRRRLRNKFVGFFHEGIDDVGLASAVQLLANKIHYLGQFPSLPDSGHHSAAVGGFFAQSGNLEIAVEGLRESARYGCRGHDQHIRRISACDHLCTLQDAELVLLVNDDKPKIFKLARFVEECVRAHDNLGSARVPACSFRRPAGNPCSAGRRTAHAKRVRLVREEIERTLSDPGDVDAEIHELCEGLVVAEGWIVQ